MKHLLFISLGLLSIVATAQNIGIGETAPANKLSVKGSLSVGSGYSTTTAPSNGAIFQGNVGIGTASPGALLDIATSATTGAYNALEGIHLFAPNIAAGNNIDFLIGKADNPYNDMQIRFQYAGSGSSSNYLSIGAYGVSPPPFVITAPGYIGIGTTTPASALQVIGKTTTTNFEMTTGAAAGNVLVSDASGNGTWTSPAAVLAAFGTGTQNYLTKWNNATGTTIGNSLIFDNGTNVGIGTATPAFTLDVNGVINAATGFKAGGAAASGSFLRGNGSNYVASTLTLPNSATTGDILYASGSNAIGSLADVAAGAVLVSGGVGALPSWVSASGTGVQGYWTRSGTNLYNTNPGDNVSIGGSAPSVKLDVSGSVALNGGLNNTSNRPSLAAGTMTNGEIRAYSASGITADDGFMRISAGGGTTPATKSYIDLSGYSNGVADMLENMVFGTAGTERMRILSTGYVGISQSSPNAQLDVNGNIQISNSGIPMGLMTEVGGTTPLLDFDVNFRETNKNTTYLGAAMRIDSRSGSPLFNWLYRPAGSGVETNMMVLTSANQLGIGTTSPLARLMVYNGINNTLTSAQVAADVAVFDGGSGTANSIVAIGSNWTGSGTRPESQLQFWVNAYGGGEGNGATISTSSSQGSASGQVNGNLLFLTANNATAPAEKLRITSAGYVGIGTTTPQTLTEVSGGVTDLLKLTSTIGGSGNHAYIDFQTFSGTSVNGRIGTLDMGSNNGSLVFETGNQGSASTVTTERMRILNSGQVGIGTTTPGFNLQVVGTGAFSGELFVNNNGTGTGSGSTGCVQIGDGTISKTYGTGFLFNSTVNANATTACSDARIKTVSGKSDSRLDLATLQKIQVTDYKYIDTLGYNDRSNKKVIAQQVKEVFPQAVFDLKTPRAVPDIYQVSEHFSISGNTLKLNLGKAPAHSKELKPGSLCEFYLGKKGEAGYDGRREATIAGLEGNTLTLCSHDTLPTDDYNRVFVYGSMVDDFLTVDYDAISMLNVSATQELYRIIKSQQETIEKLNSENTQLKSIISTKADATDVQKLKASVETLQQILESKAQK